MQCRVTVVQEPRQRRPPTPTALRPTAPGWPRHEAYPGSPHPVGSQPQRGCGSARIWSLEPGSGVLVNPIHPERSPPPPGHLHPDVAYATCRCKSARTFCSSPFPRKSSVFPFACWRGVVATGFQILGSPTHLRLPSHLWFITAIPVPVHSGSGAIEPRRTRVARKQRRDA
jgi:hypothetical protein